jgi:hypothetical protein
MSPYRPISERSGRMDRRVSSRRATVIIEEPAHIPLLESDLAVSQRQNFDLPVTIPPEIDYRL